jgi:hypothetical protein
MFCRGSIPCGASIFISTNKQTPLVPLKAPRKPWYGLRDEPARSELAATRKAVPSPSIDGVDNNFPFSVPTTSTHHSLVTKEKQANKKTLVLIDCNIRDHTRNDDLRLLTLRFVTARDPSTFFLLHTHPFTRTSQVVFRKRWSRIFVCLPLIDLPCSFSPQANLLNNYRFCPLARLITAFSTPIFYHHLLSTQFSSGY